MKLRSLGGSQREPRELLREKGTYKININQSIVPSIPSIPSIISRACRGKKYNIHVFLSCLPTLCKLEGIEGIEGISGLQIVVFPVPSSWKSSLYPGKVTSPLRKEASL